MVTVGLAAADIATPTAAAASTIAGRIACATVCRIVLRATDCSWIFRPPSFEGENVMQDGFHQIDTGRRIWLSRNAFAAIRLFCSRICRDSVDPPDEKDGLTQS
ncbi:MAG TPA: hypothetical protein VFY65_21240 [Longimicrobium sp.]|nr:hypothetical protein [Longimicrobium sp.]